MGGGLHYRCHLANADFPSNIFQTKSISTILLIFTIIQYILVLQYFGLPAGLFVHKDEAIRNLAPCHTFGWEISKVSHHTSHLLLFALFLLFMERKTSEATDFELDPCSFPPPETISSISNTFDEKDEQHCSRFFSPVGGGVLCHLVVRPSLFTKVLSTSVSSIFELYSVVNGKRDKLVLLAKRESIRSSSRFYIHFVTQANKQGKDTYQGTDGHVYHIRCCLGMLCKNREKTSFLLRDNGLMMNMSSVEASTYAPLRQSKNSIQEHALVQYKVSIDGCSEALSLLPRVRDNGTTHRFFSTQGDTLLDRYRVSKNDQIAEIRSRHPRWNSETREFILGFSGQCNHASLNNWIFDFAQGSSTSSKDPSEQENIPLLLIGAQETYVFNIVIYPPFSLFQAFGIAISSFARQRGLVDMLSD